MEHRLEDPTEQWRKPNLKFRNDIIKEMWLQEPAAVRAGVEAYREEGSSDEGEDGAEADENLEAEEQRRRETAFAFQRQERSLSFNDIWLIIPWQCPGLSPTDDDTNVGASRVGNRDGWDGFAWRTRAKERREDNCYEVCGIQLSCVSDAS